ncbi:MAG: hypothetical protein IJD92_04880 [Bacilli bacterium]|nr:hypothetical protein [Bacilli bacterium]
MYINSFITELSKKIETVGEQLKDFESKIEKINNVKNTLSMKTLKDIDSLTGEDLVLLSKEDFESILDVFNVPEKEEKMKIFFNASVLIKVNRRLTVEDEVEVNNSEEVNSYKRWLNDQVTFIKEYIKDFNDNNKEYYNSLKLSDNLYKKYIGYFKNDKLIKPIYNIEEFNEVIKKSGIITSDKWQLLKYVGEKNIDFQKKNQSNKKEVIEYSDEEIFAFVETILNKEKELLGVINEELVKTSLEMLGYDDDKIKEMNLTDDDIVKYQKIPILDTLNKMYLETKDLLKDNLDKDALKINKNFKDLLELIDSYNVIKKIDS